ncbi:hypothetical protein [Arthrobacter sp. UYCu712]|uniref:hypothetical protein n=1 Tax=Arthrobacter sp. UYCu712 TaxID=3156340 RepID=UPI0033940C22
MMIPTDVAELEYLLQQAGIDPEAYWIGEFREECACIMRADDGSWETFVGQRGEKDDLRRWDNEGDACVFFIGMLWTDISMELHRRAHQ